MVLSEQFPIFLPVIKTALLAALCGGMVGLERELRDKPAGLKTNALICLGAAMYVYLGDLLITKGAGDLTRIPGQVITGMGFIGAGAILREGGSILGLTTAATLWTVTAVGLFIGAGYFALGVVLAGITVGLLVLMRMVEVLIEGRCALHSGQIVFQDERGRTRAHLAQILSSYTPSISHYTLTSAGDDALILTFQYCDRHDSHRRLLLEVWQVEGVKEVRYPV